MNPEDLARRTLWRIHGEIPLHERLHRFLNDPANIGTERYRRVLALLEVAETRRRNSEDL